MLFIPDGPQQQVGEAPGAFLILPANRSRGRIKAGRVKRKFRQAKSETGTEVGCSRASGQIMDVVGPGWMDGWMHLECQVCLVGVVQPSTESMGQLILDISR
jgi:hypothetical protein